MKRIWQKAKKATAFLLAVMLIAAMCPMSLAAEADSQVVDFSVSSTIDGATHYWTYICGLGNILKHNPVYNGDSLMGLRAEWEFASGTDIPTYTTSTTAPYAVAYKFKSEVSGRMQTNLEYWKSSSSGVMRAHCIPVSDVDKYVSHTANKYLNEPTFKSYVLEHLGPDVEGFGTVNFASGSGITSKELDGVTLKAGEEYYLIFVLIGQDGRTTSGTSAGHIFRTMTFTRVDDGSAEAPTTLSYIVRADERTNDSKVTVSDDNYTVNGTNVGSWTVDTSFTATATGDDFAYWANGNGTPVSESDIYTFTPTSNFVLEAVYAPADTTTKKVQFWNYNKVYLGDKGVTDDNKVESMPASPSLNGWNFTNWKTDANTVFTADTTLTDVITRVVAQFTKQSAPFTVDGASYDYDAPFTKTAAAVPEGQVFSHWTINDQVASYAETLSFNVWNAVNVAAVYADAAPVAVPTVVLDKVNEDEYFIHYEVPAGYTAIDAGIVFGTSGSTPRIDSYNSKANVKKAGAKGQFTAAPGDDTHTDARGYIMYKDSADNYRIIYSAVK